MAWARVPRKGPSDTGPTSSRSPAPTTKNVIATVNNRTVSLFRTVGNSDLYAKSALDMACWDLKARAADQPLCEALGGRFGEGITLYRSVSQMAPDAMAKRAKKYLDEGYKRLQVKVGLDPNEDVERLHVLPTMAPVSGSSVAPASRMARRASFAESTNRSRLLRMRRASPRN